MVHAEAAVATLSPVLLTSGSRSFFSDSSAKVRQTAARCFFQLGDKDLRVHEPVIQAFVQSPTFLEDIAALMHALEESTEQLPDVVCSAAERIVAIVPLTGIDATLRTETSRGIASSPSAGPPAEREDTCPQLKEEEKGAQLKEEEERGAIIFRARYLNNSRLVWAFRKFREKGVTQD